MAACGAEIAETRLLLIIIILSFLSHLGRDRARFRVCGPCPARKRTGIKKRKEKGVRSDCRLNRVNICTHTHTRSWLCVGCRTGPIPYILRAVSSGGGKTKKKNIETSSRSECLSIIDNRAS